MTDNEIIEEAIRLVREGVSVTLPVNGNSMLPFIIGGKESVILQQPQLPKVGDVVLAWTSPGRWVVHRIIRIDGHQVTLMGDDLRAIPNTVILSRKTVKMIWENLFWAFIYNIVCIPLAAGALRLFGIDFQITPMWASALMAFSSVSVVLNSLRLKFVLRHRQ